MFVFVIRSPTGDHRVLCVLCARLGATGGGKVSIGEGGSTGARREVVYVVVGVGGRGRGARVPGRSLEMTLLFGAGTSGTPSQHQVMPLANHNCGRWLLVRQLCVTPLMLRF